MKLHQWICAGALLTCAHSAFAAGNINVLLGSREMKDDEWWAPVEKQTAFGVTADFSIAQLPLYVAVGLNVSADNATESGLGYNFEATGAIAELSAGLKLMPRSGAFRPYVGAGIVRVGAVYEYEYDEPYVSIYPNAGYYHVEEEDSDADFGGYLNGGFLFRIGRGFNVGLDVRVVEGTDLIMFDGLYGKTNGDSVTVSLQAGFGWD